MSSLSLIPWPLSVRDSGRRVEVACFAVSAAEPLAAAGRYLAARLQEASGCAVAFSTGGELVPDATAYPVRISFCSDLPCGQSYRLRTQEQGAVIEASAHAGAYYGVVTLLQLMPPAVWGREPRHDVRWSIALAEIEDAPRLNWRGVLVDSSRAFQPVQSLLRFIDVLGQHKINVFHWHLTDDHGWRLEIKKYPELTRIGSVRRQTQRGHIFHPKRKDLGGDGIAVEGFYTQEQVREVVRYAAERGIHVLPEIDMPGHAQAAIAAYPQFGLCAEPVDVSCFWGHHKVLFNVRPQTMAFLKDVLDEVMELFPFEYIHCGGDEAFKDQWQADADTQERIRALGLKDEVQLQDWFTRQIAEYLESKGRRLVGWDEILEGGNPPAGATIMSWQSMEGAVQAARLGVDAIACPQQSLYLDSYQGAAEAEPLDNIPQVISLEKVHAFEPVPAELDAQQRQHIVGVQACLWAEYIPTASRLEYMAFPRVCALAEVGWCHPQRPDYADFVGRLLDHLPRLDCQDVRYRALRRADFPTACSVADSAERVAVGSAAAAV